MILGFHKWLLPVAPKMRVRIKKGTQLRSTHPQRHGTFEAGRTYTVTVHHVLPGQTYTVGSVYDDGRAVLNGTHWRDLYHLCQSLGIDYPYGSVKNDECLLSELRKTGLLEVVEKGHHQSLRLHTQNPKVRWAGSGGYWVEADINDVEVVGWYVDCDGKLNDLSGQSIETFLVDDEGSYLAVHIGEYDGNGPGFRVDDTYVLHADKPELEAL